MSISIRAELKESLFEDFELIKEYLGIENNTDVIRSLIRDKARTIRLIQSKNIELHQKEQLLELEPSESQEEAT